MSDPSVRIHELIVTSAQHLVELMDGGASVFTFTLGAGGKPMTFDLGKHEDLITVTRFHLRHLITAFTDLTGDLAVAETLCEDMGRIIAESLVRDTEGFNVLDPDKSYLFAADDDYERDNHHFYAEDDFPRPPHGLWDND